MAKKAASKRVKGGEGGVKKVTKKKPAKRATKREVTKTATPPPTQFLSGPPPGVPET